MSNQIALLEQNIYACEVAFQQVSSDRTMVFRREAEFAMQIIGNNSYALGIATSNPQSLRDAVTNVGSIGLSLNPARKLAYLVPRDKKICLDVSYMGLLELAVASGSVNWAKADVVRQLDVFALNGYDKPPTHTYSPFATDRGSVVGVYVVAKLASGDYLTDTMTIDEVYEIRGRSTAWKAHLADKSKKNPWVTDDVEMVKKTIIKRAYKTWPRTDRLDQAVHYLNTDGEQGIDLNVIDMEPAQQAFSVDAEMLAIASAKSHAELQVIWKRCSAACLKAKDRVGNERLKAAVLARDAVVNPPQGGAA